MNRRSALKTAIGACAAIVFPWRATSATEEVDQVKRIKRLIEERCHKQYLATVRRDPHCSERIDIWWDDDVPDDSGLYACGLVLLCDVVAESMNDKTLTKHLVNAFLIAISDGHVARQELLEPDFKGKPVWIIKDKASGVAYFVALDINTLGGLSKT